MGRSKKIRVGINGSCLVGTAIGGWARYTLELIKYLKQDWSEDVELHVFTNDSGHSHTYWEQMCLPSRCQALGIDVLHAPANGGLPFQGLFRKIVTVHDLFSEKEFSWLGPASLKTKLRYKLDWWITLEAADIFLTVSDFCANEMRKVGIDPVYRIYEGGFEAEAFEGHSIPVSSELSPSGRRDLIYVGSDDPRKQVPLLVEKFLSLPKASNLRLKLIGRGMIELARVTGSTSVIGMEDLSEEQLRREYRNSLALVSFSREEGFGLPMVEAMACGVPVIYSGGGSIPEIVGDCGIRIEPDRLESAVHFLISNEGAMSTLRQRCLNRAERYSWKKMTQETVQSYFALMEDVLLAPS